MDSIVYNQGKEGGRKMTKKDLESIIKEIEAESNKSGDKNDNAIAIGDYDGAKRTLGELIAYQKVLSILKKHL